MMMIYVELGGFYGNDAAYEPADRLKWPQPKAKTGRVEHVVSLYCCLDSRFAQKDALGMGSDDSHAKRPNSINATYFGVW